MSRYSQSGSTRLLFILGMAAVIASLALAEGGGVVRLPDTTVEAMEAEAYPVPCLAVTASAPGSRAAGVQVPFTATVQTNNCDGGVTFSWTFGDGSSSSSQNPTHAYTYPGNYTWTLLASAAGSGGVGSYETSAQISITGPASVVVPSNPKPILQSAGQSGATREFTIANSGTQSTAITLTIQGTFFTVTPTSFVLGAGAEQLVTVTALDQPAGPYAGSVTIAGDGVPPGLSVPVNLISFDPPGGPLPDIVPLQVRIDVSGSGETVSGAVQFKNIGLSPATGVFVSDHVWLTPQTGIATIAPDDTIDVSFLADRLLLGNPLSLASEITTLRFVFPSASDAASRVSAGSAGSGNAGLAVSVGFAQPVPQGLPAIPPGQIALALGGLRRIEGPTRLLTDLRMVNALDGAFPEFKMYLLDLVQKAADAQSVSQAGQPSGGIALAAPSVGTSGTFSAHLRGEALSDLLVSAVTMKINDETREVFQLEVPRLRSDRGARPGDRVALPGAAFMSNASCKVVTQEVSGAATTVRLSVLGSNGETLMSLPSREIGVFEAIEDDLTLPAGAATISLRNEGPTGRVFAFATEEGSDDGVVLSDPRLDRGPASEWIVPWVTAAPPSCGSTALCLLNERFILSLRARDPERTGNVAPGVPIPQNDLFGYYALPGLTGNLTNPEVFVKMLDGTSVNGNFWVFFGGLTDLEYTLKVTDTLTSKISTYLKPAGSPQGGFDVGSGVLTEQCPNESGVAISPVAPSTCTATSGDLCLNDNRFRVELFARDQRTDNTGSGLSIPQNDLFGYFAIPELTSNPDNPEVFVKVLDGRPVNGNFWVFYGGLTDLEYTITVTDTVTGQRKTFSKAAGSACGGFDVAAFTDGVTAQASSVVESTTAPVKGHAEVDEPHDRTALAIYNPGSEPSTVRVEYWDSAGVMRSQKELTLLAGAATQYENVVTEWLGVTDGDDGYLRIAITRGAAVPMALRVGTGSTGKTVLTVLPIVPSVAGYHPGETASLGPLEDASAESKRGGVPSGFTPTLGIVETQGSPLNLEVSVRYASSRGLAQGTVAKKTYSLAPNQMLLVPDLVRAIVGEKRDNSGDLHDVIVRIRGVSGSGGFLPFVISESIGTGDATVVMR